MEKEVFIVSVARTPIGAISGSLATIPTTRLGSIAIKSAIERAGIKPEDVQEVYMGNVITANEGQAPARQAALFAGIPNTVVCTTINKVCASGAKSIILAAQSIMLGVNDIVIAGGMESMSNAPYYLDKARQGYKLGHGQLTDGVIKDGLWDVYNDYHMGNAAERTAKNMNIGREAQDAYAAESFRRTTRANEEGRFKEEIVPVEVVGRKETVTVSEDEDYKKVNYEKIPTLKPSFQKDGTITAANASSLNDGASALVLMSGEKVKELGLKPLARIVSYGETALAPEDFPITPVSAIKKALKNANLQISDIDFFEINEAFAVVSIANNQLLGLDPAKVNVNGGAIAMGHPIGSSGARIMVTLTSVLKQNNGRYGAIGICNGGGGASAIIVERV